MNNFFKMLPVAAALAASSSAMAIDVGGVVWDPNSPDDFFVTDTMYETTVTNIGDELTGYGLVVNINGDTSQSSFCPGCELTYQFGGYTLDDWLDVDGDGTINAGDNISFTGGWVEFYVDFSADFALDSFASAGSEGGANTLWLDLSGHSQTATFGSGSLTGTLFSTLTTGTLGTGEEGGNGFGNFDVVGGLAAAYFDTNTEADGSDFRFTSSFQPRNCSPTCPSEFDLFGSNEMFGDSVSVPEPASLALLGIGVLGLAAMRRKQKA